MLLKNINFGQNFFSLVIFNYFFLNLFLFVFLIILLIYKLLQPRKNSGDTVFSRVQNSVQNFNDPDVHITQKTKGNRKN